MPAVDKLFDASGEADILEQNAYAAPPADMDDGDLIDDMHEDVPDEEDHREDKFASMAIAVKARPLADIQHAPAASNSTGSTLRQKINSAAADVEVPAASGGFFRRLFGR